MESYCSKCRKHMENVTPHVSNTTNGKIIILSNVRHALVKNLSLLISKKQMDY